ncbi:hypothetical protein ACHMW6_36005 [Pseudoduganella sp. UC29_106]|uniref:hypothetical protein n=1 Tax=Pseudoduganella sp. UC29_106 TaxID=3374553 RepID=UPI003756C064
MGPSKLPLRLSDDQVFKLRSAQIPDQVLENLRVFRLTHQWTLDEETEFRLVCDVCNLWHSAGHSDLATLVFFAKAAFDTQGKILKAPDIDKAILHTDISLVRENIQRLVNLHMEERGTP